MIDLKIKTFDDLVIEERACKVNSETVFYGAIVPLSIKLLHEQYVGNGTVELLNCSMSLNPRGPILDLAGVKKTNVDYVKKELDWYLSEDLSIIGHVDDIKIWNQVCTQDDKKEINSNYGYLVFSEGNCSQFSKCLEALKKDKLTRNALIIYNRPSIHEDYVRNGMHDMICTVFTQFFIRDNQLEMVHVMRSNDVIFGFLNDFAWNCFVYQNMYESLKDTYPELDYGLIRWTSTSMHCYERHYKTINKIVEAHDKSEEK